MALPIYIEGKDEVEHFLLTLNIGLLSSIMLGASTIDDADKRFYNPYIIKQLEKLGIDSNIIELFLSACELGDINQIIPANLATEINNLINISVSILKSKQQSNITVKKWISINEDIS